MKTTKLVIKLHVLVIFELQVDIIHLNVKAWFDFSHGPCFLSPIIN